MSNFDTAFGCDGQWSRPDLAESGGPATVTEGLWQHWHGYAATGQCHNNLLMAANS